MSVAKEQYCQFCGEPMGVFKHSVRFDGPLVCGQRECNRDAREQERQREDEIRQSAEDDGYERYR